MRETGKIAAYVLGVVLGAALLAPPLFWLGQWAIGIGLLPALRPFAFDKYFNRAALLMALALLVPWLRWLRLRPADMALRTDPGSGWNLGVGVLAGVISLAAVAAGLLWQGDLTWRAPPRGADVLSAAVSAAVVATLEEGLFRGVLLGVLRRSLPWPVALGLLTALFGALHFVSQDPAMTPITQASWHSGLDLLPHLFWQFGQPHKVFTTLCTLLLMGWALGMTVVRTGSLHLAVGLHAGWVFGLKMVNATTWHDAPTLWIGHDLRSGLAPACLMGLTCCLLTFLPLPQPQPQPQPAARPWNQASGQRARQAPHHVIPR